MYFKKLNIPRGKELLQLIVQLFFIVACFAMFLRYGVKYDTGLGYREVILILIGTAILLLFFIKNIKFYFENSLFSIIGILIIISFLFSDIKSYGLAEIFAFFAVANTIVIISQLNSKKIQLLVWGLLLTASVVSIYGIIQFAFQSEIRVISNFVNPLDPRQGFPNAVALFMLIMWPYAALNMINSKSRIIKTLCIAILGLIIAALYLTFSRGAYIAFGIQFIILAIFNYKYFLSNKFKWIAVILISIVLITGTLFIRAQNNIGTYNLSEKLTFSNNENITSVAERSDFFRITLNLILEKPVFGYGPQTFKFIYPSKQELLYANSDHPHNIFLKTAFESGVVCAIFLVVIFVSLGIKSIKKADAQKNFMAAAIGGALAHNMIDYNFNFLLIYIVFAITVGILISKLNEKTSSVKTKYSLLISKTLFLIFCVLSAGLSLTGIRDYFKTDPYADFETIKRYTESELETHISKYSKSFYPREFWIQLSDYYFTKSDLNKALDMVDKHIETNPHDIFGFLNKGRILYNLGRYEDAISAFNTAIKLDSKNSLAVHYYYLKTFSRTNQSPPPQYLNDTLYPILDDFMYYAKHNLHFVSMKPEIEYAECIMGILKNSQNTFRDWDMLLEQLNTYKKEYNKDGFSQKVCL